MFSYSRKVEIEQKPPRATVPEQKTKHHRSIRMFAIPRNPGICFEGAGTGELHGAVASQCCSMQVPLPSVEARTEILRKSLVKLRAELNQVTRGCEGSLVPSWWFNGTFTSTVALQAEGLPKCDDLASNSRIKPVRIQYLYYHVFTNQQGFMYSQRH